MALFNKSSKKQNVSDSTINADKLLNLQDKDLPSSEEIKPELSIHPDWQLQSELFYVYKFQNSQLPPLSPNQISISGIQLDKKEDGWEIQAFIRHSLSKSINLGETTLLLLGDDGKMIGRKTFDLSKLGTLNPKTSRPWMFKFLKSELSTDVIPTEGWKLAFELKQKHHLDLAESWQQSLAQDQIDKLDALVNKLTPPKPGELNMMGLQAQFSDNNDLSISILIRNGSQKNISIESLPLNVEDACGDSVAFGSFKLEDFEVKANTSKPWTFVFPANLVKKENPDLSTWKVSVPK